MRLMRGSESVDCWYKTKLEGEVGQNPPAWALENLWIDHKSPTNMANIIGWFYMVSVIFSAGITNKKLQYAVHSKDIFDVI